MQLRTPPASSTNKTDRQILLKVAIKQTINKQTNTTDNITIPINGVESAEGGNLSAARS